MAPAHEKYSTSLYLFHSRSMKQSQKNYELELKMVKGHHHGKKSPKNSHSTHAQCDSSSLWNEKTKKCESFMPLCDPNTTVKKMNTQTHQWECVAKVQCGIGTSKHGDVCVKDSLPKTSSVVSFFDCEDKHKITAPAPSSPCKQAKNAVSCGKDVCELRTNVSGWKCVSGDNVEQNAKTKATCASHNDPHACAQSHVCKVVPEHRLPNMRFDEHASKPEGFGRCVSLQTDTGSCEKAAEAAACMKLGKKCKFETRHTPWQCVARNSEKATNENKQKCDRLNIDHNASACHESGDCIVMPHDRFLNGERWLSP